MKAISCPGCSASEARPCLKAYDLNWRTSAELFTLVRCASCGTVYLTPAPEAHELGRYYPERYYTRASGSVAVTEEILKGMSRSFRRRLNSLPADRPGTMLDIGSGDGHFVSFMRSRGWDAWGVEISAAACAYAVKELGLPPDRVINGDILEVGLPAGVFDLITMYDVLEHLPAPAATVAACAKLLKPGGRIFIQVPNFGSLGRRVFGAYWVHIDAPRHISHYETKTLRRLFSGWGDIKTATITDTGAPYIPGYSDSFRRWLRGERPVQGEVPASQQAPRGPMSLFRKLSRSIERPLSRLLGSIVDLAGAGEMIHLYARKRT